MQDTLARKLRVIRADKGLTLRQAAAELGVTPGTLSELERGLRHPHDVTLSRIAKGYGVPVEELLEEPVLAGKAEGPLSPEWAHKADPDLFRLMIRDASSEQLRELGVTLLADFHRVQTREDLKKGPTPEDARRIKVFSLVEVISEELRRRNEDPLEQHVLAARRQKDALPDKTEEAGPPTDAESLAAVCGELSRELQHVRKTPAEDLKAERIAELHQLRVEAETALTRAINGQSWGLDELSLQAVLRQRRRKAQRGTENAGSEAG